MKLSVDELVPEMKLSEDVYSDNGKKLLSKGTILNSRYIFALKKYKVKTVEIESVVKEEKLNKNIFEDIVITKDFKEEISNIVNTSIEFISSRNMTAIANIKNVIGEILRDKLVLKGLKAIKTHDSYTFLHCIETCVFALVIGHRLGINKTKLIQLGKGAVLHDIGKIRVPLKILNKSEKLNKREFAEIKKHSVQGYRILNYETNGFEQMSAVIVLNHHERIDGTGYPRKLKDDEIQELSMICGIADIYSAMTTNRVYRQAVAYDEAYKTILGLKGKKFKKEIVEAFLQCIEPYPVGVIVRLNTNEIGCVTKQNKLSPFNPIVVSLPSGKEVDLSKNYRMNISCQLSPRELQQFLLKYNLKERGVLDVEVFRNATSLRS